MSEFEVEVLIADATGDAPKFEVTWHIFGPLPTGDAHNALVAEKRQFIEDAIRERLANVRQGI